MLTEWRQKYSSDIFARCMHAISLGVHTKICNVNESIPLQQRGQVYYAKYYLAGLLYHNKITVNFCRGGNKKRKPLCNFYSPQSYTTHDKNLSVRRSKKEVANNTDSRLCTRAVLYLSNKLNYS